MFNMFKLAHFTFRSHYFSFGPFRARCDKILHMSERPKEYWFKRKRYGWGWVPATIEGWLVVAAFLVLLFLGSSLMKGSNTAAAVVCWVLGGGILIWANLTHGPAAKWRWGWKPDDDPEKDF